MAGSRNISPKGGKWIRPQRRTSPFNTGQNKFAAQLMQTRENVANFLQRTAHDEGYLVAETVRTRKQQTIDLPPPIDENDPDAEDLKIVRAEEVKSVAKRRLKLEESLKKGYVTVYSQCAEEVRDKLKSSDDWERIQKAQSLHERYVWDSTTTNRRFLTWCNH